MTAKEAKALSVASKERVREALVESVLENVRQKAACGDTRSLFPLSNPPPNDAVLKDAVSALRDLGYECVVLRRGSALLPEGAINLRWEQA